MKKILTVFALALILCVPAAGAADKAPAPGAGAKDRVELGNISVDKKTRSIRMKVKTALKEGILEFMLVGEKGKTYESAFEAEKNIPSELNFALILIGAEAAPYDKLMEFVQQEKGREKLVKDYPASLLSLSLEQNGKAVPLDSVIRDREGEPFDLSWVYTGGQSVEGKYPPDGTRNFIAIWPNPASVVNLFSGHKNPYRGNYGYEMNTSNQKLDKGQEYTLVLKRSLP